MCSSGHIATVLVRCHKITVLNFFRKRSKESQFQDSVLHSTRFEFDFWLMLEGVPLLQRHSMLVLMVDWALDRAVHEDFWAIAEHIEVPCQHQFLVLSCFRQRHREVIESFYVFCKVAFKMVVWVRYPLISQVGAWQGWPKECSKICWEGQKAIVYQAAAAAWAAGVPCAEALDTAEKAVQRASPKAKPLPKAKGVAKSKAKAKARARLSEHDEGFDVFCIHCPWKFKLSCDAQSRSEHLHAKNVRCHGADMFRTVQHVSAQPKPSKTENLKL